MELARETFWFLDCQTTATSPSRGCVIELGWGRFSAESASALGTALPEAIEAHLVALPSGHQLHPTARELTGLSPADLMDARPAEEIWKRLVGELEFENASAIAHYSQFEKAFLVPLHHQAVLEKPFPFQFLCTYRIAKKLFPQLPSTSLSALSGFLEFHGASELKRTRGQLAATVFVWGRLVERLAELGVHTREELDAWMKLKAPRVDKSKVYLVDRALRLGLPKAPGIYRFLSAEGKILYIGKATNLRDRVNSYFRARRWDRSGFAELVTRVRRIEHLPTRSPFEAAVRENDEIKAHTPPYNTALMGRGEGICFTNRDFDDYRPEPDAEYCCGPFKSFFPWHELAMLQAFLSGGKFKPELFYGFADESMALEGRDLFCARNPELFAKPFTVLDLVQFGASLPLYRRTPEENEIWNSERITQSIGNRLHRAARGAAQARWMTRLSESSLILSEPKGGAVGITVHGGRIEFDSFDPNRGLPNPPGWKVPEVERLKHFDAATYDRMSILLSEIRRLLARDQEVHARLSPCAQYPTDRLKHWLGPSEEIRSAERSTLTSCSENSEASFSDQP